MRTRTKIWLITALFLTLVGCILFASVMTAFNWDFMKLSTVEYETSAHEIIEAFNVISVNTDTADVKFVLSDTDICKVECYENANAKHSVFLRDGMLNINLIDDKPIHNFIRYIGLNFDSPKITIHLPKTEYASLYIKESTGDIEIPKVFTFNAVDITSSTGDVNFYSSTSEMIKIKTDTGNINIDNISVGTLDLTVSTGKVNLSNIACKSIISIGNTGDIFLNNVIASENFAIERSTGNVKFNGCDATEILIKTDTGDVNGALLTNKLFITETDTGDINVPNSVTGDRCEITTDTGDINITVN